MLKGNEFVFTDPGTGVKTVGFWLDDPTHSGTATHTETTGPYDYVGGSATAALAWDTTKVADGTHTITQVVTPTTGAVQVLTATFTIANTTATPTPTPTPTPDPDADADAHADPDSHADTHASRQAPRLGVSCSRRTSTGPAPLPARRSAGCSA